MADELKNEFGANVKLIGGAGGIFDVALGDEMVFSKHEIGRFPDPGEIVELLKGG
ncbi:MAG: hypothetical protein GY854_00635 [Deltaproteobacteria bacterium]|nr:hypothetical protein [Deltaproteobacteria bacterium]